MVLKEWVNIPGCSRMVYKAGRSHTDFVLDQGLKRALQKEAIYSHQIILENSNPLLLKNLLRKNKLGKKQSYWNSSPSSQI